MTTARKQLEVVSETPGTEAAPEGKPSRFRRNLLMFSVPVLLTLGGGYVWLTGGRYITTDNAYVHQPLVPVSADISGRIIEVNQAQNQFIKAGDVVFRVDPEPYRISLEEAEASLDAARQRVAELRSAYSTAQAQLEAAKAIADVQARELGRQQSLLGKGVATPTALDEAMIAAQSARNAVTLAEAGLKTAAAALGGDPAIATDDVPAVRRRWPSGTRRRAI